MLVVTVDVTPFVMDITILQEEAVLCVSNVVWLSNMPLGVVNAIWIACISPNKLSLGSLISTACVPAITANRRISCNIRHTVTCTKTDLIMGLYVYLIFTHVDTRIHIICCTRQKEQNGSRKF